MAAEHNRKPFSSEDMALDVVRLRFRNPQFEKQFYESWLRATRIINQRWVLCGITFFALYTVILFQVLPQSSHQMLWTRLNISLPIICLVQVPLFIPKYVGRFHGISYLIGSLTAFFTVLYQFSISPHQDNILFLLEIAVILVFCQHYNRIMFALSSVFAVISGSATVLVLIFSQELSGLPIMPVSAVILALILVGMASSYTRETFVRRNYRSIQILRAENRRSAQLVEQAAAASEAKSRFLAVVSHELRTPLNAIIGYSEMIAHGMLGPVRNTKVQQAVDDIASSGKHLLAVVNDVLDLSRSTYGKMELQECLIDFRRLMVELQRSFGPDSLERGVSIVVEEANEEITLNADKRMVKQMLFNLVSNAIKFTKPGGEVRLSSTVLSDGSLRIDVRDNGIGIAGDKIETALSMFGQADDDLNRRYGGIGIGLPLTREFVRAHGGDLHLQSEPNVGTTISLIFPSDRVMARASVQLAMA